MNGRRSRFGFFISIGLAVVATGWLVPSSQGQIKGGIKGGISVPGGAVIRTGGLVPAQVRVELTTFTCLNADEDAFYSNGDEPYLLPIAVYVDGTTVNLQQMATAKCRTQRAPRTLGNLNRKNVKSGDRFAIPADTGLFQTQVRPLDTGGTPGVSDAATLAGILVIAAEEDSSSRDLVAAAYTTIIQKLEEAINAELQKMGRANIHAIQETLHSLIKDRVNYRTIVNFNFPGLADPDDFIGVGYAQTALSNLRRSDGSQTPQGFDMRFETPDKRCAYSVQGQFSIPPPPRQSTVRVQIHRVKAIDDLEGIGRGEADFYARVSIDRVPKDTPEKTGNTIRPEWVIERSTRTNPVPVVIELFEEDSANTDERCDIDRTENIRALSFMIDTSKPRNQDLINGQRVIRRGGGGDKNRCEIEFTVSWS